MYGFLGKLLYYWSVPVEATDKINKIVDSEFWAFTTYHESVIFYSLKCPFTQSPSKISWLPSLCVAALRSVLKTLPIHNEQIP
jgi:hypothetical protein